MNSRAAADGCSVTGTPSTESLDREDAQLHPEDAGRESVAAGFDGRRSDEVEAPAAVGAAQDVERADVHELGTGSPSCSSSTPSGFTAPRCAAKVEAEQPAPFIDAKRVVWSYLRPVAAEGGELPRDPVATSIPPRLPAWRLAERLGGFDPPEIDVGQVRAAGDRGLPRPAASRPAAS